MNHLYCWIWTLVQTQVCKFNGYIVLCRTCSHCTDSDWDPYFLFLCRTGIRVHTVSVSKSVPESVSGNVKRPSHQGIFEVNKSCRLQAHPNCVGAFEGWIVVIVTEKKREDGFRRLLEAGGATVTATK